MCHSATWFLFCVILFWPNSCVIEIWPHWYKNVWLIPSPCSVLVWIRWAFSQCLALTNPAWETVSEPLTQWGLLSLCALGWVPHCTSGAPSPSSTQNTCEHPFMSAEYSESDILCYFWFLSQASWSTAEFYNFTHQGSNPSCAPSGRLLNLPETICQAEMLSGLGAGLSEDNMIHGKGKPCECQLQFYCFYLK